MNPELTYLMALTYVPGLGPINQRKILKEVRAKDLWEMNLKELKQIFRHRPELIAHFESTKVLDLVEKEIEFCLKNNINIIDFDSDQYPQKLKECSDSPLIFFKKGNYDFDRKLHIGIVGTRKMTSYGKKFIEEFITEIAGQNIAIISGLAFGCDIEAHRMSNQNQIPNVAVLAHGLNRISPSSHRTDANEIIDNGALLTEYSSFHNAEAINFVLRNRIIAGLSDAVIVVESDRKGGALATANYANSYNREVFAVPGRVADKFSLGCNDLIQSNQAYLIRDANDLLTYFNLKSKPKPKQFELFVELDTEEKLIYELVKTKGRVQIDEMVTQLQLPIFKLNSVLLNLELKGIIKPLAGKFFELS